MRFGFLSLIITHQQEAGLLVGVRRLAPPALFAQPLRILHRHQPVRLEAANQSNILQWLRCQELHLVHMYVCSITLFFCIVQEETDNWESDEKLSETVVLVVCRWPIYSYNGTEGVCVFGCNLPPTLLAEWLGDFTCYCGNMVGEDTKGVSTRSWPWRRKLSGHSYTLYFFLIKPATFWSLV